MRRKILIIAPPCLLPTTVVGSYPVPEWMERLKSDFFRGKMSHAQLQDVHEMAINIDETGAFRLLVHQMVVPDLVVKRTRLGHSWMLRKSPWS